MEINWDITIEDLVTEYPKAVSILLKYGIKAMVCGEPIWGTIKEAAEKYSLKDSDKEKLLQELRELTEKGKGKKVFIDLKKE